MKLDKIKLFFIMIIFFSVLFVHNNVQATGAQANKTGDRLYNKSFIYFFELIRQMETEGGTLGKEAEINTTSYVEIGTGNGIDCHMAKNTEWGTAALLAGSEFGYTTSDDSTSTGKNGSGLYEMGVRTEYTGNYIQDRLNLYSIDARYWNRYSGFDVNRDGDGFDYCEKVSTVTRPNYWMTIYSRGTDNDVFFAYPQEANGRDRIGTRAAVVCGTGL